MRNHESAGHERPCAEVEFAHGHGILTAVGERQHTTSLCRLRTLRPMPHPIRPLGARERVEVEHCRPRRRLASVARHGGTAPDTAHVRAILPEVVELSVQERRKGHPIACLGDRKRVLVERREARIPFQHAECLCVFGAHPGHGAVAVDVLEPAEGVGRRVGARCLRECSAGGNERGEDDKRSPECWNRHASRLVRLSS